MSKLTDEEKLYDSLNKRLTFYLKVIKHAIWPITGLILVVGIWWGIDFSQARKEINNYRDEIQNSIKINLLSSRELDVSFKELALISKTYKHKLDSMELQMQIRFNKIDSIIKVNEIALYRSEKLYKDILKNNANLNDFNNSLVIFVESSKRDINKIQKDYEKELIMARNGVDERIKIEREMLNANREVQMKLRQMIMLSAQLSALEASVPTLLPPKQKETYARIREEQKTIVNEINKISRSIESPK